MLWRRVLIAGVCAVAVATGALAQNVSDREAIFRRLATAEPLEKLQILNDVTDHWNLPPLLSPKEVVLYSQQAVDLARQTGDRRGEARALKNLAGGAYEVGDYQGALEHYFQSRSIRQALGDLDGEADINLEIGHIFNYCFSDFSSALVYYNTGLDIFRRSKNVYEQVRCLISIGEVNKKQGKWEAATETYLSAMKLCDQMTDARFTTMRANLFVSLGEIFILLEDYGKAQEYLKLAEPIYEKSGHPFGQARVFSRFGEMHRAQKQYDLALKDFKQALAFRQQWYSEEDTAAEMAKLAVTYSMASDFKNAMEYFGQALAIQRRKSIILGSCQTLLEMGRAYARVGRFDEAHTFLNESLDIALKNGFVKEQQALYQELSTVSGAKGDSQAELTYRKKFDALNEQMQLPKMHGNVARILSRYENEKVLAQVLKLEAQKGRMVLIIIAAVLVFGAVVLVLLLKARRIRIWMSGALSSKEQQLAEQHTQLEQLRARLAVQHAEVRDEKYKTSKLSDEQANACLEKLLLAMDKENLFLESELTLDRLAQHLGINRTYLSQTINKHLGKSFNEFVSQLRVEEAKAMLAANEPTTPSTLEVGYAVGFSSKSSFYKAFKKYTGITPVEYRSQIRGE